jgi:Rrf2 family protein
MARAWPRTSATYLSKVVQALVEAGILASVRGSGGGYCLADRTSAVSLLDVVSALEGPFDGRCPLTPNGPCELRASCQNYSVLLQLQDDVFKLLSRVTIQQLASNLPRSIEAAAAGGNCAQPSKLLPGKRQISDSDFCPTVPVSHLKFDSATSQSIG